jgi:isovaleryl-CoA dehydrogenase
VEIMVRHAQERKTFGRPILEYGQIQRHIADGYAATLAARCLVNHVARTVAADNRNRLGSDAAKLFAAPVGKQVADAAMQVMGGAGYCREYPVERLWRDAKLLEIGGGTIEAHQKNLAKDLAKMMPL